MTDEKEIRATPDPSTVQYGFITQVDIEKRMFVRQASVTLLASLLASPGEFVEELAVDKAVSLAYDLWDELRDGEEFEMRAKASRVSKDLQAKVVQPR